MNPVDEKLTDEFVSLLAPTASDQGWGDMRLRFEKLQEAFKDLVGDRSHLNKQIRELQLKVDAQEGQIESHKKALKIALDDAAKYKLKWEIETERFDQLIDKMIGERR